MKKIFMDELKNGDKFIIPAEYSVNYYAYAKGIRNEDLIKK